MGWFKRLLTFEEEREMLEESHRIARETPGGQKIGIRYLDEERMRVCVTCYRLGEHSGSAFYDNGSQLLKDTVKRLLREGWRIQDNQTQDIINAEQLLD